MVGKLVVILNLQKMLEGGYAIFENVCTKHVGQYSRVYQLTKESLKKNIVRSEVRNFDLFWNETFDNDWEEEKYATRYEWHGRIPADPSREKGVYKIGKTTMQVDSCINNINFLYVEIIAEEYHELRETYIKLRTNKIRPVTSWSRDHSEIVK